MWNRCAIIRRNIINNQPELYNLNLSQLLQYRFLSSLDATFEHVRNPSKNSTVIDVREPKELAQTGVLPKSLNIPLGEVERAFKFNPNEFKSKYGFDKPSKDSEIIFSCLKGIRSETAANIARQLGYTNVKNYRGGWAEYEQKIKSSTQTTTTTQTATMTDAPEAAIVTYEDVRDLAPNTVLIDVRDPQELQETGQIPKSINIPLGQLIDVFKNVSDAEFKSKFGIDKPTPDTALIFSCKLGGRARKAYESALELGYDKASFYKGSWTDWAEKSKQQ